MRAELIENRLVVWNITESRKLFASGFFGKPIGIPKPKPDEFDAPIILDLIEGYYLSSKSELDVFQDGREIGRDKLLRICGDEIVQFKEKMLVYAKLRDAGFVVTPGVKFGADFAAYERGPGLDHAPYLVRVYLASNKMSATDIVLAGRLATTVRKQFIIAVADSVKNEVFFIGFDWWRA
ncbi:MAG: tRNA-intron lyase [Nitrososphaerota archaeon]|nr:tRNA-intron lyase [Nitrososphaerota archaeon]MDG6923551.1 tRNA-intron lyase [Nitrososphaerota archaeon]